MSQVSLFIQWLHVLEQLGSYFPVSQPKQIVEKNTINQQFNNIAVRNYKIITHNNS